MNPRKIPDLETTRVGAEVLVHDPRAAKVHVMNGVAARILELCDGDVSAEAIAAQVSREYDADPATVTRDVAAALGEFAALRLLEPAIP